MTTNCICLAVVRTDKNRSPFKTVTCEHIHEQILKNCVRRVQVFEELLLDADLSVNAGSWMWLSCSAFFQQFFHCYCPVGFGRRVDPSGEYIR